MFLWLIYITKNELVFPGNVSNKALVIHHSNQSGLHGEKEYSIYHLT